MSAQLHGPETKADLAVGAKFKQGRSTFEVVKVTPAMVLAESGRKGQREQRWFWKRTLANAKVLA